jgi:site-specific recombinase XerD
MARIQVSKDPSGYIVVSFPYDPLLIATAKTIPGHKWHPVEKYWSFPNTDETLERILEAFQGREIHIDPSLQDTAPSPLPENITSYPGSGRNNGVTIDKEASGTLKITFPYRPALAAKVRTLKGRKWHPEEKYWSVPYSEGIVEKILKVFEGIEVHLDPALKTDTSKVKDIPSPLEPKGTVPDLRTERGGVVESGLSPKFDFEDLRKELVSRKYSYKTIKGYLYYNKDFINYARKNPSEIKDEDIKDYLVYLSETKGAATSTLNQAINALKFYYGTVLKKKFIYEVRRPRKDTKLPVVLSKEEVSKILTSVDNLKHRAILMLVYSAGLRVGEVVRLKTEDIDSNRKLIHIKGAKGRKDRYTLLSEKALEILNQYRRKYRPEGWLFGGAKEGRYLSARTADKIFTNACDKAGIKKDVSLHVLRHSFAPLEI